MASPFIEEPILDMIAYGFSSGPGYATTAYELISGKVARNAERTHPVYKFRASYQSIRQQDRQLVIDAFNACLGRYRGFRFKDRSDYLLINEPQITAVAGQNVFQLTKAYTFGPAGSEVTTLRNIRKPVEDQVTIFLDDIETPSVIDWTTGTVTITAVGGEQVTATGQFDVPVMFEEDQMFFSIEDWDANTSDVVLREDRTQ